VEISAWQVIFFLSQEKSLSAFPVQIRIVYFVFTLFGLWPEVRLKKLKEEKKTKSKDKGKKR